MIRSTLIPLLWLWLAFAIVGAAAYLSISH